jgi:hypothetical protein
LLFLLVPALIAGCGRSDASADAQAQTGEAAAKTEQRVEEETGEPVESVADLDELKRHLASDQAEEASPTSGDGGDGKADARTSDVGAVHTWTDSAGRTLARGEFISLLDGKVCLQEEDGTAAVIPLEALSRADREYVNALAPEDLADDADAGDLAAGPDVEVEEATEPATVAAATGPATAGAVGPAGATPQGHTSSRRRKVVIPFDFVSKFDEGRYGQIVAEGIWKKLDREGGFLIPDSMYDVRDLCTANHRKITPSTPLAEVAEVVRRDFDADVGIWGSVERAPGHDWDVYDFTIKCVDFSGAEPNVIYEKTGVRTKVVSEIPHVYVKEMLEVLYDRRPGGPPPVDQLAEENWKNNPSLVEGGDFQKGARGVPAGWAEGWEGGFVGQYEPLGNVVQWIPEAGNPQNRVIRITMDKALADSTGVPYYSDPFPVEEGAKYRFQCRWRSNGPSMKVFIKCYAEMATEYTAASAKRPAAGGGTYVPESTQLRECYRSQQNLYGPKNAWNVHTQDFTPKHTKYTPRWGRVMLYAYHPAGVAEFDDVVLKQIVPPSPGESNKDLRHSMESDVTIEQMRENERRGAETRERLRQRDRADE